MRVKKDRKLVFFKRIQDVYVRLGYSSVSKAIKRWLRLPAKAIAGTLLTVHGWLLRHSRVYRAVSRYGSHHPRQRILASFLTVLFAGSLLLRFGAYASDVNKVWDFSNPTDYSLEDSDKLEYEGSSVRLKAQNYATDSNTKALYHLDEASGTTVADSSSNSNTATATNPTWGTGNLNNALQLNGTTSQLSADDSTSLSLTQSNTLEAWTKFNDSFTAGSTAGRQSVIDKGPYQLYYDDETGKAVYELQNSSATNWQQQAGGGVNRSWDLDGKNSADSSVGIGNDLYIGTGSSTAGDAEVWKLSAAGVWTQIGGAGLNNSWAANTFETIASLETDGTNLYAGTGLSSGDGEVWMWNGTTWSRIGGDAINSSWAVNTYNSVLSMDYFGGNLYAGLGSGTGGGEVWRYNGSSWTKIGGDGLSSSWAAAFTVKRLENDGTNLYAGTGNTAGMADVWRWNGTIWAQIGGDGINSSWAASTYEEVLSSFYMGSNLYIGLGTTAGDAEVWRWSGGAWTKLASSGVGFPAATYTGVYSLSGDGTNLYAGVGSGVNLGDVWKYNGSTWTQVGNDGLNSSWTGGRLVSTMAYVNSKLFAHNTFSAVATIPLYSYNGSVWQREGGQYFDGSWGYTAFNAVQSMTTSSGKLYAGLTSTYGGAIVFEFNGGVWQQIGGNLTNGSWDLGTFNAIESMTSYNGNLVVGTTGTVNGDAEVWSWDGSTWTKLGGDGLSSSWNVSYSATKSLAVNAGILYAGVGSTGNNGGIWKYESGTWVKIGGDGTNGSWNNVFRYVTSMNFYNGELVAGGTGSTTSSAEVWKWNGSSWTKIGGDGVGSSWNAANYLEVNALATYQGKLIAGIGGSAGDGEVWRYDGTTWTLIGGDSVDSSWDGTTTHRRVATLTVYNGDLYAGTSGSAGDGEAWRYNGSTWSQAGGDSISSSWTNAIISVRSMVVYKGKLYTGLGDNISLHPLVYSLGNNGYLESTNSSYNTDWRHIAATYDGTTMKLYINGQLDASTAVSLSMSDTSSPLLIGSAQGPVTASKGTGKFKGMLDEVRISNSARTNFTTTPYTSERVSARLATADYTSGIASWDDYISSETTNGGTLTYRLSDDDGTTWKFWNGSAWAVSADLSQANGATDIGDHIATFPVSTGGITWQAVFDGDGNQRVQLNSVSLAATADNTAPAANASSIVMKTSPSGPTINSGQWTNAQEPYFSWTPGNDAQSTIKGYCLYLGTSQSDDPVTSKGLLGTSPLDTDGECQFAVAGDSVDLSTSGYLGSPLVSSNSTYYLNVKAIDNAGNVFTGASESFAFKFDNTNPTNPLFVSAPSQFVSNKQVTITWPTSNATAADDNHSGVAGLQYKIGAGGTWYGDGHTGAQDVTDLLADDGSYQTIDPIDFNALSDGNNTIYFRTYDNAGNFSASTVTGVIKINTTSPTGPQNVTATPATNTTNAFAFSWSPPATFGGSASNLEYCYSINTLPSVNTCTYTDPGVTSLVSGAYATQPGENTFYVVAKDEAGNINYATTSSAIFTANTSAPGIALNLDIVDISVKSTNNWRLALSWDEPTDAGAGIASYKVYRSADNITFTNVASTAGTSYVDGGLSQQPYYYKVRACDSANNCGAYTSAVDETPTGKYTTAANSTSAPEVSSVSTRKATISWSTDRQSDSRIQYGIKSGQYFATEAAISDQVTDHEVLLNNLSAGTTYYYKAKWTDEDGNTGQSAELSFKTAPAPVVKEVTSEPSLSDADINFTSKDAAKVKIYFGKSESFGGLTTLNTSLAESKYGTTLTGLDDGSKYFFKLNTLDSDGNEYEGNVYSFTTPPRPRITNLRFQPVKDQPSSTQRVTWNTNVPSSSEITYGVRRPTQSLSQSKLTTEHEITIKGLSDDSDYVLIARSRDASGNVATSDQQSFKTALDTRPPKIADITVDTSIRGTGAEARGQVVISWKTDEPATSQVAYGEGSSGFLSSVSSEDAKLTTDHVVVVSDLSTSRVYHFEARSFDRARNEAKGDQQVAIIGRASENVLSIIFNALQKMFGIN